MPGGSRVKVGRAVFEIGLDDEQFRKGLQDVIRESAQVKDDVRGISQAVDVAIFRELGQIAVAAISSITREIGELATRGAEVTSMERSFNALTSSVGETSDVMLSELRVATQGLVDDMTLMQATNKSILLGLPATSESMSTLAQTAVVLGRAMGQDAAKSFDDLTTALGRSSPLILDNLGLTVKVGQANEAYAAKLGKTADQLTDVEKKMAFYEAAMEAAKAKVDEIGAVQLTFGDRLQQTSVFLSNFRDELSKAVANSPVLAAGLAALTEGMQRLFGGDTSNAIRFVMGLIEGFAGLLVDAGRVGIEVARVIANAWYGLNVMFNGIMAGIVEGLGQIVGGVAAVVEAHTYLPGVGRLYVGMAEKVRGLSDDLLSLGTGFAVQAVEALDAAAETNRGFDEVSTVLAGVKVAMEDAGRATRQTGQEMAAIATSSRTTAEETVAAAQMTAAELKRLQEQRKREAEAASKLIADTERRLQQELALSRTTGLQQQLLQLEFARQEEIRGLESLRENYGVQFAELSAMVNEKYEAMKAKARETHSSIEVAAREQGFKTRAELESMAQKAKETYDRMLASGLYTTSTLQAAWEAYEAARGELTAQQTEFQISSGEAVLQGAQQIFGALGQRFKAAAIAGAIIATYSAVAKALASAPWPANLVLAAGALAAGMQNVARIRSSDAGFEGGTPGLDYADFGRVQYRALHHEEAVIPRGKGHMLADEIAQSMPSDAVLLRDILDELRGMPRANQRAFLAALQQAQR